jgi:hypothetical protein
MDRLEIKKGIFQDDVRRNIRINIKIQYELEFESFLQTNYLADENFYINYIDKNQKEIIAEYEKIVNFHDISEGREITDDIADQCYNESKIRDHYWYYIEYQSFLKERLAELEKLEISKEIINILKVLKNKSNALMIYDTNSNIDTILNSDANISKSEILNLFSKDYLQGFFKRIDEIFYLIYKLVLKLKICFDETDIETNKLTNRLLKFKKGIFNTLETSLESLIKSDHERLLFEYLNITNKLETELKIEGKNISDLFKLFYERLQYIKLNPKPQQPEADTSTVEKNIIIIKEKNSEMFSNNGFELFEHILNEHVKPKDTKGRKSDLIYYYWEMFTNTPQYIHQRPAPFFNWFENEYNEITGQLKTYDNVKTEQRKKDYSTALDWFKSKNK